MTPTISDADKLEDLKRCLARVRPDDTFAQVLLLGKIAALKSRARTLKQGEE